MVFLASQVEELASFKSFEAQNNGINLNDIRNGNLKSQKDHKDGFFL